MDAENVHLRARAVLTGYVIRRDVRAVPGFHYVINWTMIGSLH